MQIILQNPHPLQEMEATNSRSRRHRIRRARSHPSLRRSLLGYYPERPDSIDGGTSENFTRSGRSGDFLLARTVAVETSAANTHTDP